MLSLHVCIYTYITHTHRHTQKKISRDLKLYLHKYSFWHIQKQSTDDSDFWEREKERLGTDTRIFRTHNACTGSPFHTIKQTLTPHKHRRIMCVFVCVCVCVLLCVLLTRPPPQYMLTLKNVCDQNPPTKAQQKMWHSTRRRFCATEHLFRGSAQTSSPGKPHLKP